MTTRALLLGLLVAGAAAAAQPMSREDFRSFAEGWTLHFVDEEGRPFGAETYLPGGDVIWKPEGGSCAFGVWGEAKGRICFLYDVAIACWEVFRDESGGVSARSADDSPIELRVSRRVREPLVCEEAPAV